MSTQNTTPLAKALCTSLINKFTSSAEIPDSPINLLKKEEKINGTDVTVYVSALHRNGTTMSIILAIDSNHVIDSKTDMSLTLHFRKIMITDLKLTARLVKSFERDIIYTIKELLDEYIDIRLNKTVVAKQFVYKDDYKTHIELEKLLGEANECYICYDSTLAIEKLNCGHYIHSHCLSTYCSSNNFEDPNRDYDENASSFKCGYCRKHTAAPMY
jgi:hypothetical protein